MNRGPGLVAPGPRISSSATLYPLAARDYQRCPLLTTRFTFVPAGLRRPGRGLCAITRPRGRASARAAFARASSAPRGSTVGPRGAASPGHEEPRRTPARDARRPADAAVADPAPLVAVTSNHEAAAEVVAVTVWVGFALRRRRSFPGGIAATDTHDRARSRSIALRRRSARRPDRDPP